MQINGTIASEARRQRPAVRAYNSASARNARWAWVETSVWTERMLAALGSDITRGKWYSLIDKVYRRTTLHAAWRKVNEEVQSESAHAGIGPHTLETFERQAEGFLAELEEALRKGTYQPQPTGGQDIDAIKDRIAQTAVKMVVEPIFEAMFLDVSYGFRPKRGASEAVRDVGCLLGKGRTHVVDIDLSACCANVPHDRIIERMRDRISDRHVLALMEGCLRQGIMAQLAEATMAEGLHDAMLSPLMANLILHPLDARMTARGYRMVRHAGRLVVLCATAEDAQQALREVRAWTGVNGFSMHADNAHVRNCSNGEGFDFLGYWLEAGTVPMDVHMQRNELPGQRPSCAPVERMWQVKPVVPRKVVILNS